MAEEYTTADQIKLGDTIKCICEQGCYKADTCVNYCKPNPCDPKPQGTWEKILEIALQPATNNTWFYFSLTNNKQFGLWGQQLVIRYIP